MFLKLIRRTIPASGKAVLGTLYSVHFEAIGAGSHNERLTRICDTLENADYLVPEMIYRVQVTQSPKFGRLLPILCDVPGRSGIRFHRGTRPEHSKGCILLPPKMEALVTNQLLTAQKDHEEIRLDITHLRPGDKLPGMPGDASAAPDAQRDPR